MPTDSGRAATVEFEHVSKVYGPATAPASPGRAPTPGAVNDLSLAIPAGRICVLVGPSGCGKTTSLKMVNRLIEPTSGRILLDGVDAAGRDLTDLRRGIGYVIQQTGLFPHQTIVDNVGTVPRLLGWPAARVRERSEQLMGLVGLDPAKYAKRFPNQLSGGERQRVGVARALAADPPIMLMDEPFGAVDPIVRERLQDEFLRLQGELAKTILFVTHDIDEAIKMGDLVAVFQEGGRVAQFGTPTELLARPASDFVARFVGVDRALKRLSLSRVGEIELQPAAVGRVGDPVAEARQRAAVDPFPYLLLVDAADHPVGWVTDDALRGEGTLSEAMAVPMSPFLSVDTSLKDAMSLMLDADVHSGIVLDHDGHLLGLLTSDMIGAFLRRGTTGSDEAAQAAS